MLLARFSLFLLLLLPLLLGLPLPGHTKARGAPDVLVIGDSQLTFGAGAAFVDLLRGMAGSCGIAPASTVGVIGVRSSALTSWTGTSRRAKGAICDVDPKWRVNAGAYGSLSQGTNPFIQIGRGDQFQLCHAGQSPLNALFDEGYYAPRLLILFLMGNAADRWAASPSAAVQDVAALIADLPPGQPCVLMTSAPPYSAKVIALRQKAQDNLARAVVQTGARCTLVPGFTPATIAENQGNARNFRRSPSGAVKDPFHPTEAAARRFLALRKGALCAAISLQLTPALITSTRPR